MTGSQRGFCDCGHADRTSPARLARASRRRVRSRSALSCDSPSGWGRHLSGAEKPAKQSNLLFDWRIPVRGIACSSRRNHLNSRSPLILHRSQRVDLGHDLRALALQRGQPGHKFRNSAIRLRHRENWHASDNNPECSYLTRLMVDSKPVEFRGSALEDLRAFPEAARREAGYQLDRIQHGREPDDWKPMNTVGRGCGKFGFEMLRKHSGCCMWRSSTMRFTCCIVSRKRRRKRATRI
jgi:hypothetical protein